MLGRKNLGGRGLNFIKSSEVLLRENRDLGGLIKNLGGLVTNLGGLNYK